EVVEEIEPLEEQINERPYARPRDRRQAARVEVHGKGRIQLAMHESRAIAIYQKVLLVLILADFIAIFPRVMLGVFNDELQLGIDEERLFVINIVADILYIGASLPACVFI